MSLVAYQINLVHPDGRRGAFCTLAESTDTQAEILEDLNTALASALADAALEIPADVVVVSYDDRVNGDYGLTAAEFAPEPEV